MKHMEMHEITVPKLGYSYAEAEIVSGLSRTTLWRAIKRGDLPHIKVGRRVVIPAAELAALCGSSEAA